MLSARCLMPMSMRRSITKWIGSMTTRQISKLTKVRSDPFRERVHKRQVLFPNRSITKTQDAGPGSSVAGSHACITNANFGSIEEMRKNG